MQRPKLKRTAFGFWWVFKIQMQKKGGESMPNHVTNIIELECSRERSKEIMEFLRADGQDYGSVDFNKLIPMPESLNITSGSETDRGIEIYLTAVNPNTKDFGLEKMSPIEFDLLEIMLNCEKMFGKYNSNLSDEQIASFTEYQPFETYVQTGKTAVDNFKQYGATTWYEWRIANWGTKWNAYDCYTDDPCSGKLEFNTAWDGVPFIIQKISESFPDVLIHYGWADEDIGNNTGRIDFKNGEDIWFDIPEGGSKHAFEIACDIQGYDIEEFKQYFQKPRGRDER